MTDGAGFRTEWEAFEGRHPLFREALARLKRSLETAFLRSVESSDDAKLVTFGLGRLAVDDFFEVLLLSVNGYGFGALKLVRPLFERVVTGLYLIRHTDEAQDFIDYAHVHQRKALIHAKMSGLDVNEYASKEQLAEVEAEYARVKVRFTEPLCKTCGTARDQMSWTKKDLKTMADEVGMGHLYAGAAFWPTLQIHTTRTALDLRLKATPDGAMYVDGPQRHHADHALGQAHICLVHLLHGYNDYFGWGLDIQALSADLEKCWNPDLTN